VKATLYFKRTCFSLMAASCVLLFWLSVSSAQSENGSDTSFTKFAQKLREDALRKVQQPSPKRATFSGQGTGYGSDSRYRGSTGYVAGSGFRVLMVGDSLTVGGFGAAMQDYLLRRFGTRNVAVYASCGSSPEQWLRSGPDFITKCGYRQQTPQGTVLYDFQNGKRPQAVLTPKLEDLVSSFHPTTVIVQLGTNWMDGMVPNSAMNQSSYSEILDRFVIAAHDGSHTVHQIVWITPPDASRYSAEVKRSVRDLIKRAAQKDSFQTIDSNTMTHYVPGKSGSDGVHYNSEEAKQWANSVVRVLDPMLR
jgi:lysophospholipase L1-like esterase